MTHDPFLAQLAVLCRTEPSTTKWVVVPSHYVGHTLGDRLAREEGGWANLRLVTPLDLAVSMAGPWLIERGIEPFDDALGPGLTMRLSLDLPEKRGYFRPLADQAPVADALWRAICELRLAGLRSRDLRAGAFTSADKYRELLALMTAYERHLDRQKLADQAAVLDEAMLHVTEGPLRPEHVLMEVPDAVWSPLVRQFLDALPGRRLVAQAVSVPGARLPDRAQRYAAPVTSIESRPRHDASRLRWILHPERAGGARRDGTIEVFHAGGRDAEISEVCRRILASGRPLDQVEIACAHEAAAVLAWEQAARLEWPVTIGTGVPAALTRSGRLFLRFCEWLASDFACSSLRRLLQSGDCSLRGITAPGPDDDVALGAGRAARVLLTAQATWGRDSYGQALKRLAAELDRRAADPARSEAARALDWRRAAEARALDRWIEDLLGTIPEPDGDAMVPLAALAESAAAFLDRHAVRASPMDVRALEALVETVRSLASLGEYRCSLEAGVELVRGCVTALRVGRDRPRPGHLHVSSLSHAGFDGRPLAFIVGLEEAAVFPRAIEDAVLLDEERTNLSERLRTSTGRLDEAVCGILSRLAAVGLSASSVCVSFSCRDTREFRDSFPSWLVLAVHRLQQGDATLTYEHLARHLGEPVSLVPADPSVAATEAAWWLATCESNLAARAGVLRGFPSLARGAEAEQARESAHFSEFDGFVPEAGAVLDPSARDAAVSATALEDAATCPFRYFLRHALGVEPIEEAEAEADAWLSPLTRGAELHALYARLVRFVRGQGRAPELRRDLPRLRAWADARLEHLRRELPPPSEEVFARERREFLDDVEAFLVAECDGRHGPLAVGVEVSFGLPLDEAGEEPLAREDPFVIPLGGARRLRFRGRIDRVNRLAPGRYEVLDYKTGGYWPEDWKGVFAGGTRLQHAVYGRAAEDLLAKSGRSARVERSVYVFPAVKGHRIKKVIEAPSFETLRAVLQSLTETIAGGAFLVSEGSSPCRYCEFSSACLAHGTGSAAEDELTRGAAKLANEANTMLAPLRRLRSHA